MAFPLRRRLWAWTGLAVLAAVLASAAIASVVARREREFRSALQAAERELERGRYSQARRSLTELSDRRPDDGRVWLALGRCEELMGKPARALAALERIPATDPNYATAVESRSNLLINQGRYRPAEELVLKALREAPPSGRPGLLRSLARVLKLQGRFPEVSLALIASWAGQDDPSDMLEQLWENDTEPIPIEAWKLFLDGADAQDDRVWLGRARLALATARLDEARAWLGRCQDRRFTDPVVRRAAFDLAVATEDFTSLREASARLPAGALRPEEVAQFRVWAASRGPDRRAEQVELRRLLAIDPADSRALERLAVLATEEGRRQEGEELQRRKAEIDRAKDWIHKLVINKKPFRQSAPEVARQMAILGRTFDAAAWAVVAGGDGGTSGGAGSPRDVCRRASESAFARILGIPESADPTAGAPADSLTSLLPALDTIRPRPGPTSAANDGSTRLHFTDDAEAAGLKFTFESGKTPQRLLPEILAGGMGLIDYDGDGWLDVYCVQGGEKFEISPPAEPDGRPPSARSQTSGDRLFRNGRNGTFRDVTREAQIDRLAGGLSYGMGVTVGDYDNDGHPDLFLTRVHRYDLLRNRGDGTFEDVTARVGLSGRRENPTSAAFADLDGDGDLDLYVCHYMRWDPAHLTLCAGDKGPYYCDPSRYERAPDHVFRNDGGRFVDVTESSGFTDLDGRGLGVVAADLDDDNRIDLFVANDGTANFLFQNRGGFRFEDVALTAGVAGNAQGGFHAGMGVAAGDLDRDGRPDVLVTNLYLEGTTFYRNLGSATFADRSAATGLLLATRFFLGFGVAAFDAANRGRLDVAMANGNVNDFRPLYPFMMPARLYESRGDGRFVDVSDRSGPAWSIPHLGRALATGDLDNDGRVDLAILLQDEPVAYLHNRTEGAGHFATFRLEGTRSNRDGVGARITVTTAAGRQVTQRFGGGSYLAASDDRIHFGLGPSTTVQSVEVRWPSGQTDRWDNLPADTGHLLREGEKAVKPLAGFPHP